MNWQSFIDRACGSKPTFTNAEVRALMRKALEYECENWIKQRR